MNFPIVLHREPGDRSRLSSYYWDEDFKRIAFYFCPSAEEKWFFFYNYSPAQLVITKDVPQQGHFIGFTALNMSVPPDNVTQFSPEPRLLVTEIAGRPKRISYSLYASTLELLLQLPCKDFETVLYAQMLQHGKICNRHGSAVYYDSPLV